jgi:outer membrane receptor protein involved in Fe transport
MAALLSAYAGVATAADANAADANASAVTGVEEIVVTAERRDETVENTPLTVQALTGATLSSLNINDFDDLLKYTPNVTYGNNGPGQGTIFMRGLSAGFAGSQSTGTIGNFPNVAIYLDDESMQFPARNVDIYMVDMQRVEVDEGPQGTLFGGGAEAGAIRYITNKPNLEDFGGNVEASYGFTEHGDPNSSANATLNIPIVKDKLAVRLVVYDDNQGGYIDNVPSNFTRSNQDLGNDYFNIKPNASGICPNGLKAGNAGLCAPNAGTINNSAIAGNAQNPVTYSGARFSVAYKVNNDWDVLIEQSLSNMNAQGLSVEYPTGSNFQALQPLEVTAFEPSYDKDDYENTSWTVNGNISGFKVVYTGSYMVRNISQQMDYTNYARSAAGAYYECTGGSTGWGKGAPQCNSPAGYWDDSTKNTHLSNEIRVSSPDTWRLRFIAGVFNEDFKIYDIMNFNYKTIPSCTSSNLAAADAGGAPCVADVTTAPGSTANDPGVRGDSTAFGEDTQRGYDQTAVFGSLDFDIIPHVLTVSAGTRYYRYSEYELGSVYETGTYCLDVPNGQCTGGMTNINNANDKVVYSGFKSRANITWHVTNDTMTYFTFSQGFRPGGFNRTQKDVIDNYSGQAQYQEPNSYAPDSLTNYEIGLKTEQFDHRLLLNLSAYFMQWSNVQFLIYDPTEGVNSTFGVNGPGYNVKGLEAQFVGKVTQGLTIQGSGSYNDDTQSTSPCLMGNIAGTSADGKCITQVKLNDGTEQAFTNPFGTLGSTPAFSPAFEGNIRARYDWRVGDYKLNVQIGGNYTGGMYNEPSTYPSGVGVTVPYTTYLRYYQPGYATMDASIGIAKDRWTAEIFGKNLTNSNASMFTSSAQFIESEVPIRPLVVGLKIGASF